MENKKFKLTKKQLLSGVVVVGLLAAAAAAGFGLQFLLNKNNAPTQTVEGKLPAVVDQVQDLRMQGDQQAVSNKINEALKDSSTSNETKYMLYIQQGNVATDKSDWKAAIDSYLKAAAIKETYEVTGLLAETYKQAGDKNKAIEYYKKAIPLIPDTPVKEDDKAALEAKIKALGGQP
ncbi:MAG TPA: tetratricopeptide repeat protein [Candidatus Saccharimonadales bacterium]|nr:tetratricopeptide repeat protein [Candidatus Saccharimonadales bacterium]